MPAKKACDAPASDEPSKSLNALARRAKALKDWLAEDAPASDDPSKTSTAAQATSFPLIRRTTDGTPNMHIRSDIILKRTCTPPALHTSMPTFHEILLVASAASSTPTYMQLCAIDVSSTFDPLHSYFLHHAEAVWDAVSAASQFSLPTCARASKPGSPPPNPPSALHQFYTTSSTQQDTHEEDLLPSTTPQTKPPPPGMPTALQPAFVQGAPTSSIVLPSPRPLPSQISASHSLTSPHPS
jgi:hypothetical protein